MKTNHRDAIILSCLSLAERYGLDIRNEVERRTKAPMPLGSLYVTLSRMESRGLIRHRIGEPIPGRGGNLRKYWRITPLGRKALNGFADAIR